MEAGQVPHWGPDQEPIRKAAGNTLPLTHLASTWSNTSWVVFMVSGEGPAHQLTHASLAHNDAEFGRELTQVSSRAQVCKVVGQDLCFGIILRPWRIQNSGTLWLERIPRSLGWRRRSEGYANSCSTKEASCRLRGPRSCMTLSNFPKASVAE